MHQTLDATSWPTVGEEIAVRAAMDGLRVDVDWLGKTLRPEDYQLYVPQHHLNPFTVWAAIELYALDWSLRDIGDHLGFDHSAVLHWMIEIGHPRRPKKRGHNRRGGSNRK